ncbi:methyltransferase domain-containing protein [archaeon]|nr:MAG: methyltransferase domain-containing protein [archaeon]
MCAVKVDAVLHKVEERLPFEDASFDIVLSSMALHWVNNLPGVFSEVRRVLKPDGVFIGAMPGQETLYELRSSFVLAEQERAGGVGAHVSPLVMISDVGNLLSGAGFAIPTVDTDPIVIGYPHAARMMEHLQSMGESNASVHMAEGAHFDTLLAAAATYQSQYGEEDGTVPASFDIINFIGWSPDSSQPKPLRRGSVPTGFGARGGGIPEELQKELDKLAAEGGDSAPELK